MPHLSVDTGCCLDITTGGPRAKLWDGRGATSFPMCFTNQGACVGVSGQPLRSMVTPSLEHGIFLAFFCQTPSSPWFAELLEIHPGLREEKRARSCFSWNKKPNVTLSESRRPQVPPFWFHGLLPFARKVSAPLRVDVCPICWEPCFFGTRSDINLFTSHLCPLEMARENFLWELQEGECNSTCIRSVLQLWKLDPWALSAPQHTKPPLGSRSGHPEFPLATSGPACSVYQPTPTCNWKSRLLCGWSCLRYEKNHQEERIEPSTVSQKRRKFDLPQEQF